MDKYDEAIEYLTTNPEEIENKWHNPSTMHGCLFQFATPTGHAKGASGCLTLIRRDHDLRVLGRPDLTEAIRNDTRIPILSGDIRVEHLPVFAEWQRRLDKELNRV